MKITIIGTGYVGLVNGACLAQMGHLVNCVDNNENKIAQLNSGIIPIYEPGLEDIIKNNVKEGRLFFSSDYHSIVDSDLVFIAVGTPTNKSGHGAELIYVENAVKEIAMNINKDTIIIMKSTVPVGTSRRMKVYVQEILKERGVDGRINFDVISNPEFLKEGDALNDFFHPDRIVVGAEDEKTIKKMKELYGDEILIVKTESSELIKYASNAMLATRISFMNEIANLCEKVGAKVDEVKKGVGKDTRIGEKFLNAGCGYGGSCFPKDVNALLTLAKENGVELKVVKATEEANLKQKHIIYEKMKKYDVNGKTISILGLSFKPNTDDMRESPALVIINDIQNNFKDIEIKLYDPMAKFSIENCGILKEHNTTRTTTLEECLAGTDFIILVTEWEEFKNIEWNRVKEITNENAIVIDGRNIFNSENVRNNGFIYERIG